MNDVYKEYAKALFMLAVESDSIEKYGEALAVIEGVFVENPEYIRFLSAPAIPLAQRLDAIEEAFSSELPREVLSFLKLLCEKGMSESFSLCYAEYKNMQSELGRISVARVTSAVALTDGEKNALKKKLEGMSGHTVELECAVDEAILGGLVVKMDGKMLDASLKRHLKDVKDVMSK